MIKHADENIFFSKEIGKLSEVTVKTVFILR
jgi:hypothetical protein